MDAVTAFIIATCFALLNGSVLGFVHASLTDDLKPSASDWRIGTLLIALSGVMFAANGIWGALWALPIANGLIFVGIALYLRSIHRYTGRRDSPWLFAPAILCIVALSWFTFGAPNLPVRVALSSLVNVAYTLAMIHALIVYRRRQPSIASAYLIGLLGAVVVIAVLRLAYYVTVGAEATSVTAAGSIVGALTPLVISAVPIVGTTAFALLCFERIRHDLHRVATTDALTGLPNRRTIAERGVDAFARARAERQDFALAVIDIDHFKRINDGFGHDAGDRALRHVSELLAQNVRGQHVVGRQGGEEFVALFPGADLQGASAAAERLCSAIENNEIEIDGVAYKVTVSIGVASMHPADRDYDDILRRADRALYRAKAEGRNCVR